MGDERFLSLPSEDDVFGKGKGPITCVINGVEYTNTPAERIPELEKYMFKMTKYDYALILQKALGRKRSSKSLKKKPSYIKLVSNSDNQEHEPYFDYDIPKIDKELFDKFGI